MKIGTKVFIREGWITKDYMVYGAEIVDIAYYENSQNPKVYLVNFVNNCQAWFDPIALKA